MERAFQEAGQTYDVVSYVADGKDRGKFEHWRCMGDANGTRTDEPVLIERPNEYIDFSFDTCPVVLKIHGAIDRDSSRGKRDSFVITEDHYIDYLTRTDVDNLIPKPLLEKLQSSSILFLGYSLADWNLRAILYHIWGEQKLDWNQWAIQVNVNPIETQFWEERDVEIFDMYLDKYIARLDQEVQALESKTGGQP
jgi:hypothetical protein